VPERLKGSAEGPDNSRMPGPQEVLEAASSIRDAAMHLVQTADKRVRVEDYLTVLAAATGEAALADSGCIDIEYNDMTPGQGILGDSINLILSGDVTDLAGVGRLTVLGVMRDMLVPRVLPAETFCPIEDLYRHTVEHIHTVPWGSVAVSVPEANRPRVLPIQYAFKMRPFVNQVANSLNFQFVPVSPDKPVGWGRHVLCAAALASGIEQTVSAIDPKVGLTLALEVTFGMAKMVPMSEDATDS